MGYLGVIYLFAQFLREKEGQIDIGSADKAQPDDSKSGKIRGAPATGPLGLDVGNLRLDPGLFLPGQVFDIRFLQLHSGCNWISEINR